MKQMQLPQLHPWLNCQDFLNDQGYGGVVPGFRSPSRGENIVLPEKQLRAHIYKQPDRQLFGQSLVENKKHTNTCILLHYINRSFPT